MVMVVAMSDIYNFDDLTIDVDAFDDYTGHDSWNAVYTIQLGELVESGVFDWERPELDWSAAKYDDEQYSRLCAYFIDRFYYREISMEPFKVWANFLKRKLVYELMPKYKPLYERVAEGINPLSDENEYYKNRTIESAYPETLLSANADYITDGRDEEFQRIREADFVEQMDKYAERFKGTDERVLDELESMFVCMYTSNVNGY
jgi:hypothetical protein